MCVVCFVRALAHVFRAYLAAQYAYDFRGWPVAFRWDDARAGGGGRGALTCAAAAAGVWLLRGAALGEAGPGRPPRGARSQAQCLLRQIRELPGQLASYALARSLGRWLVYPGSTFLMTRALLPLLQQGQERLVARYQGRRAKLLACDGNEVDTMFMDRRRRPGSRGRRLVICCEGNAGFYEMGCLAAPLEAGYSVLGWNHPGFGGSTGAPFPQHDANAMDVVVKHKPELA
ncbi:protein ABHD16B isoform X2 [Talpa occidentalis]|uniref:protein ABHD16B isoform X2 n=1 Tax=Talpa occidentalis TaxID=50954 RepID=UPI0023F87AA7|nr:protein ABHD16B isoform X2 [Talpa occidentalis]